MSEKFSATIEDYLSAIFILERDGEPVTGARLAELLGVSAPIVTNTLKRMVRDGLVHMDVSRAPHLTETGKEAAHSVMRRHMLAELMLDRMVSWSSLHKEAHELEHAISNEVEAALIEKLNNPDVCPHGNPLPGHEDSVSQWIPLTQAAEGARGTIRRIHEFAEDDYATLSYLESKRVAPGQEVMVREVLPFNQTITIDVQGEAVALGFSIARYVFIEIAGL